MLHQPFWRVQPCYNGNSSPKTHHKEVGFILECSCLFFLSKHQPRSIQENDLVPPRCRLNTRSLSRSSCPRNLSWHAAILILVPQINYNMFPSYPPTICCYQSLWFGALSESFKCNFEMSYFVSGHCYAPRVDRWKFGAERRRGFSHSGVLLPG